MSETWIEKVWNLKYFYMEDFIELQFLHKFFYLSSILKIRENPCTRMKFINWESYRHFLLQLSNIINIGFQKWRTEGLNSYALTFYLQIITKISNRFLKPKVIRVSGIIHWIFFQLWNRHLKSKFQNPISGPEIWK